MNSREIENSLFSVEGKTAVVTGGTSGLGRMIAEGLVKAGARVAQASSEQFAAEIRSDSEKYGKLVRELGLKE